MLIAHFRTSSSSTRCRETWIQGLETGRGLIAQPAAQARPGFGADLHASGRVLPDGTFHGLNHDFFTPGANEAFCAALGA